MIPLWIGQHPIGITCPPFVIAEIGVNHDGSVERALELVEHARQGGADAIKLQVFQARTLMHQSGVFASYQRQHVQAKDPAEMLRRYELTGEELRQVIDAARALGLVPLATPFSLADVEVLGSLELPAVKVASPDIVNWPLLRNIAHLRRPMILSTGAATLEEVESAVVWLKGWGVPFALLHCVSSYPAPAKDANLSWIGELARFGVPVGFSDHTTESISGALAVAAGAVIVEKHLTYDRTAHGPDHASSADPAQFAQYVRAIRLAATLRGTPGKCVLEVEEDVRRVSRQSLVALRDLPKGHMLEERDLTVQRPGTGIPAAMWSKVIGRPTARALAAGTMLGWEDLDLPRPS